MTSLGPWVLADSSQPRLTDPAGVAIDPTNGEILVADSRSGRVFRFDRRGRHVRIYGNPGYRSDEIRTPAALLISGSELGIADVANGTVHFYDMNDGKRTGGFDFPGYTGLFFPTANEGRLWIASTFRGPTKNEPAGIFIGEVTSRSSRVLPLPEAYFAFPALKVWSGATVVALGDTLLVAPTALNALLVVTDAAAAVDTIGIPVVRRRGSTRSAARRNSLDHVGLVNAGSSLEAAALRENAREIILIHYDADRPHRGPITAQPYVSVLRRDLTAVCADGTVPLNAFEYPMVQIRGDTLFFVAPERRENQIQMVVRRFVVDTSGCSWIPVERHASLF